MTSFGITRKTPHALAIASAMTMLSLASQAALASPVATPETPAATTPETPKTPKTPKKPKTPKAPRVHKQQGLPSVSTGGVGRARGTTVELEGAIDPKGEATTYYFQYGPTSAYGAQMPTASLPAGTSKVKVSQSVTGLQLGYHYRLVASNGRGMKDGQDRIYTAKSSLLKVIVSRPPAVGYMVGSSLTITGALTGTGIAGQKVVLQASPYPYRTAFAVIGTPQITTSAGRFSFSVAKLTASTQYRVATLDARPAYSPIITELATVRVTFHVRTSVHGGLARLYGTVSPAQPGARVIFELQKTTKRLSLRAPSSEKAQERAEELAEMPQYSAKFSGTVKRATKSISRFSTVVSIRQAGRYRALVQVRRGPLASGSSTTIVLQPTVKKKVHRKD
jgi:hypothetical protein